MPFYFEVVTPRRAARLRLEGSFVVVGRGEPIPLFHDDPSLSREHAAIVIHGGGVKLRDLGSKNRVLLNGSPVERYAEVGLGPGDVVKLGATTLTLREGDGKVVEGARKQRQAPPESDARVDPDLAKTDPEVLPLGEANIDKDGEPRSLGSAAIQLSPPPPVGDDEEDELIKTPEPDGEPRLEPGA